MIGRVRNIPDGKFFGFISDEGGRDFFFHKDDYKGSWDKLLKAFRDGEQVLVEFVPNEAPKGLRASEVVHIN